MVGVAEYLGRLVHEWRLRHGWRHLEASHVVIHGGQVVGRRVGRVVSPIGSWDCLKLPLLECCLLCPRNREGVEVGARGGDGSGCHSKWGRGES